MPFQNQLVSSCSVITRSNQENICSSIKLSSEKSLIPRSSEMFRLTLVRCWGSCGETPGVVKISLPGGDVPALLSPALVH